MDKFHIGDIVVDESQRYPHYAVVVDRDEAISNNESLKDISFSNGYFYRTPSGRQYGYDLLSKYTKVSKPQDEIDRLMNSSDLTPIHKRFGLELQEYLATKK